MKITHIAIDNFLGARCVRLVLHKPVNLFAGHNASGKSSIQEAVRMALTGETVRVALKKEFGALLTDGADTGGVAMGDGREGHVHWVSDLESECQYRIRIGTEGT